MASPDIRFVPDPGRRWDRAVLSGSLALLMFSVLAFGAVEPWSVFILRSGAVLLLLLWAVGRLFAADSRVVLSPVFIPVALFLAVIAVQCARLSAYRYASITEGMNVVAYGILLFLAVQCARTEENLALLTRAMCVFAAVVALEAIVQGLVGSHSMLFLRAPRIGPDLYGSYVNHNHYAGMMEMVAPFLIVYAASDKLRGSRRTLVAFAALLVSASIFLSR